MFFAAIIFWIGAFKPECIGGVDFTSRYFLDAYALSWTTFSTVGYGLVYPAISTEESTGNIRRCTSITIVTTLEAFVGVILELF